MRRDFSNAVIGRIGQPYAAALTRGNVDRVDARADPAHDADVGQRIEDALGDRRVLQQDRATTASMHNDIFLSLALGDGQFGSRVVEERALQIDVGKIVVGEKDGGHRRRQAWLQRGRAPNVKTRARIGQVA